MVRTMSLLLWTGTPYIRLVIAGSLHHELNITKRGSKISMAIRWEQKDTRSLATTAPSNKLFCKEHVLPWCSQILWSPSVLPVRALSRSHRTSQRWAWQQLSSHPASCCRCQGVYQVLSSPFDSTSIDTGNCIGHVIQGWRWYDACVRIVGCQKISYQGTKLKKCLLSFAQLVQRVLG